MTLIADGLTIDTEGRFPYFRSLQKRLASEEEVVEIELDHAEVTALVRHHIQIAADMRRFHAVGQCFSSSECAVIHRANNRVDRMAIAADLSPALVAELYLAAFSESPPWCLQTLDRPSKADGPDPRWSLEREPFGRIEASAKLLEESSCWASWYAPLMDYLTWSECEPPASKSIKVSEEEVAVLIEFHLGIHLRIDHYLNRAEERCADLEQQRAGRARRVNQLVAAVGAVGFMCEEFEGRTGQPWTTPISTFDAVGLLLERGAELTLPPAE